MKKHIPLLLFLLFAMNAFCQMNCSDSVAVRVCEYSSSGDVSALKTVTLYDSLRNSTSVIGYVWENNHWNRISGQLYQYSYDGFGHILTKLQKSISNNPFPYNQVYETNTYDSPTHQSEHATFNWNGTRWVNSSRNLFYSNASGDDTLLVTETGDTSGWKNYVRTYSYYDNSHLPIHDSTQHWSGFWWLYTNTFRSYSGNLVDSELVISYNSSGAITGQNYTLHQFDSASMNMYHYYYYWDGFNWIGGLGDSTLYDAWGHVILYSDGETYGYLYDSLGHMLEYHYHGAGQSAGDEYYYYVNGVLRSSSGFGSSQGGWTSSSSCEYRYADISGPVTSCGNSSIILSAQPCTPGNQYLWNTSETTESIMGSAMNSYTVTVTYPSGFIDSSFEYNAPYSPPVQLDLGPDTMLCDSQTIQLNAGGGFDCYLWQDSSSAASFFVEYNMANTVICSVVVSDSIGCMATDSISIHFDICDGTNTERRPDFYIAPNPTGGRFTVSMKNSTSQNNLLEIFNLQGEKIYSASFIKPLEVDMMQLPKGIYFARLSDSQNQLTQKLVIE